MSVSTTAEISAALEGLAAELGDRLVFDPEIRSQFETDFGRWRFQTPAAVARCRDAQDVARVIRYCRERKIPIAPRSQGHTQSGQSLTRGVLIDTAAMAEILEIGEDYALCEAGVVWRDLVIATTERGLIPPVLTNNLSVTVSGTTSVAGLGVASFRHGSQADNAIEIECVTGDGEIHLCSREQEPELFDMVRCSLGQIAVITKVKTRLRKVAPMVRMYTLVYDDLGRFMEDAVRVMDPSNPTFATAGGICSPAPMGFRRIGEGLELGKGMIGYGLWLFPMYLTIEYEPGSEPDDDEALEPLSPWRLVQTQDVTALEFARRMEPMFEAWKLSGYWEQPHPWMETTLPWNRAQEFIETVLSNLPPGALGPGGHVLLWPARTDASDVPLFMHPGGNIVLGWGVLGSVPAAKHEEMLMQLEMASELSIAYGGKRYLSGYITFDTAERWAAHFGDQWEPLKAAKKRWDPDGILAPGFIQYE
ncbi:MAG: FAD-binding protein [Acidobacteria bacterium]|nr:FAD-binding protein [Acidobacteriota bacterium]MCB9377189.1 FAD-binding protein [Holophagales bacterium]